MFFYCLFIACVFICTARYKMGRWSNTMLTEIRTWLGVSLIVLVAILRFDVGYDYSGYYDNVYPRLDVLSLERQEPFSRLISYVAYYMGIPQMIFVLFGLINYFFIFSALKRHSSCFPVAILVFLAFFYLSDMSTIRQAAAVSITLWGFKYIERKSFVQYLLTCILAMQFHSSAIVAIFIYFIYYYITPIKALIVVVAIYVGSEILFSLLEIANLFSTYLEKLDSFSGGNITKISNIGWLVVVGVIDMVRRNPNNKRFYGIIIIGLVFPFVFGGHLGGRVAQYFLIYYCLLIPSTYIASSRMMKYVWNGVLVIYFCANIYINSMSQGSQYVPYRCVLFEDTRHPKFRR